MEDIKYRQIELIEIKNTSKMKITLEGTENVLDIAEEKTSKLKKKEGEITQNKVQNEKRLMIAK